MGRLLVTGPGHSGGNWVTEIARATGLYKFTDVVEDRTLFFVSELCDGYATKLATDNLGVSIPNVVALLQKYPDMKILFTVRHPVDNCLSKIYRGQPIEGNEPFNSLLEFSWDATVHGSVKSIEIAFSLLLYLLSNYRNRVFVVKLEDLILNTEEATRNICRFVGAEFSKELLSAYRNTRNRWQIERYGGKIDRSQINMYRRYTTIYNGFFSDKLDYVNYIGRFLISITQALGYEFSIVE